MSNILVWLISVTGHHIPEYSRAQNTALVKYQQCPTFTLDYVENDVSGVMREGNCTKTCPVVLIFNLERQAHRQRQYDLM